MSVAQHRKDRDARITFVLPNYYEQCKGGAEYRAYLLARYLMSKGYAIYYVYIDSGHPFQCTSGCSMHPIRKKWWPPRCGQNTVIYRRTMHDVFEQIHPDIVYQTHGCGLTGIAAEYCLKHGCKMVWHIASRRDVEKGGCRQWCLSPFNWVEKKALEYGIHRATAIIGQTHYQSTLLWKNYGRTCDIIVPNYQPMPIDVMAKPSYPLNVVWVGNIKTIKQPEVFIRLAQKFSGHSDARFIMVGRPSGGRYQQRLEGMLARLQNMEYRRELSMAEVNALLARSHILVNTSRYEGFPNTFIQAWMHGVPVISLNEDPDGMIVEHGLGCHSRTFAQLVSDTGRLLDDSTVRNAMAGAAQAFARKHCSLENNCARIESMFSLLLS